MTSTPDRNPGKSGKRSSRAAAGDCADEGDAAASAPTFKEQLEAAGMDLSNNPLADKLAEMSAVPERSVDDTEMADATDAAKRADGAQDESVRSADACADSAARTEFGDNVELGGDAESEDRGVSAAAGETDGGAESEAGVPHPLLSDAEWRDLEQLAPELADSIGRLSFLKDELARFERRLGPDTAMTVVNGIETASRILEAMSAVALSIYERSGTPADYGAKTTTSLVQDRLHLTGAEARRRTELAKNLGARVDMTGQPRGPVNPRVAEALHSGRLSAGQATTINRYMEKLPFWISSELRDMVETDLVEKAPKVRVSDLRTIFKAILDRIDPDGKEPKEPTDRSDYYVTARERENGDWVLNGLLDPVSGGVLNGLLTSRILPSETQGQSSDGEPNGGVDGIAANSTRAPAASSQLFPGQTPLPFADGPDILVDPNAAPVAEGAIGTETDAAASVEATDDSAPDLFQAVLAGEISDAPFPLDGAGTGYGVNVAGEAIDTTAEQGTIRNRIYERFASVISRFEWDRIGRGSPFALVVTAKAEDVAKGKGRAVTGNETEFPISTAKIEGLNGSVFFELMSDKAKTMSIQTENRYATPKQVAILAARDKGCTFPGCDAPPGWCDAHHIVPWADGGKTNINNLTLACGLHHHLIDRTDWETLSLTDGRPAWKPPASIDVERRPILHARFVTEEIADDYRDVGDVGDVGV